MHLLALPQLFGYLALVLGVSAFLQRDDRRLRLLLVAECAVYVVHFALLGNPPAAASALVSTARNLVSVRFRARWLAAASVAVNVALAVAVETRGLGWLPVVGSALGAVGVFTLQGIPMRLVLLSSTACWLATNVLGGSVGGTILESLIATASVTTIVRLTLEARAAARAATLEAIPPPDRAAGAA